MSRLPDQFMKRGTELADTCLLFGEKLTDLSREELIAAAAQGWRAYSDLLEQNSRHAETMRLFRFNGKNGNGG